MGTFLPWKVRMDINLYLICCFSRLKTIGDAVMFSPGSETVRYVAAPEGAPASGGDGHTWARLHPAPSTSVNGPTVSGFILLGRKPTDQENLLKILPFRRARISFLSTVCY